MIITIVRYFAWGITIMFIAGAPLLSQTFSVTVKNGYGSGAFKAGDTVHVWSNNNPAGMVFGSWSGDVMPFDPQEWHTRFIMPSKNVTMTASFISSPSFQFVYEKIKVGSIDKNCYYYFPPNPKGLVLLFHGTGGNAVSWTMWTDNLQFAHDAVAEGFAVFATEAEEVSTNTDNDGNGKLQWKISPATLEGNSDISTIKSLLDSLTKRGRITSTTPILAVGTSNGGFFTSAIAPVLGFKATALYIAQGIQNIITKTTVPTMFNMAKNDSNEGVGQNGNTIAQMNSDNLKSRGVPTGYNLHLPSPAYLARFSRDKSIDSSKSAKIYDELKKGGLMDGKDYITGSSSVVTSKLKSTPTAYPTLTALTSDQQTSVLSQVDVMYAEHQFFSDYNRKTLAFFKTQLGLTSVQQSQHFDPEFRLAPNPVSDNTVLSFTLQQPEFLSVFVGDVLGKRLNTLFEGVYLQGNHKLSLPMHEVLRQQKTAAVWLYIQTPTMLKALPVLISR